MSILKHSDLLRSLVLTCPVSSHTFSLLSLVRAGSGVDGGTTLLGWLTSIGGRRKVSETPLAV